MAKVTLDPAFQKITGKIGKLSDRWMYGKQTAMKTPDTPALARRCKCVQRQVERGAEGEPPALQRGDPLRAPGDGELEGPGTV